MDVSRARLIQRIYEADDDVRRTTALSVVAAEVGADSVHAFVMGAAGPLESTKISPHFSCEADYREADYLAHWQALDPRFKNAVKRPGAVLSDVDHIDAGGFERSALYNDFLLDFGIRYTLMVTAPLSRGVTLAYAFMRPPELPAFAPKDQRRLAALMPHLHRAARLRDRIRQASGARDEVGHALDRMAAPMVLTDALGTILYANHAARLLLDARDGVQVEAGRLHASHPRDDRELESAFARAGAFTEASVRAPSEHELQGHVLARRNAGPPLCLSMSPLRPGSSLRTDASGARVLVSLHDPARRPVLDAALVAARYGFTPTEARLAVALARGETVATFAQESGCTEQTARSHLKRVFEKASTSRQAELVRSVLELHRSQRF